MKKIGNIKSATIGSPKRHFAQADMASVLKKHFDLKLSRNGGNNNMLLLPELKQAGDLDTFCNSGNKNLKVDMAEVVRGNPERAYHIVSCYKTNKNNFVASKIIRLKSEPAPKYDIVWLDLPGRWDGRKNRIFGNVVCEQLNFRKKSPPLVGLTLMDDDVMTITKFNSISKSGSEKRDSAQCTVRFGGVPHSLSRMVNNHGYSLRPDAVGPYVDNSNNKNSRSRIMFLFSVFNTIIEFDVWNIDLYSLSMLDGEY
jgi:hypothetical protein